MSFKGKTQGGNIVKSCKNPARQLTPDSYSFQLRDIRTWDIVISCLSLVDESRLGNSSTCCLPWMW